jgi:hypothetical protein
MGLRVGPAVAELGITSGGGCTPRPLPEGPNVGGGGLRPKLVIDGGARRPGLGSPGSRWYRCFCLGGRWVGG